MAKINKLVCSTDNIRTLTRAAGTAIVADTIELIATRVTFAYADIAASAAGEMVYQADEIDVPKAAVTIAAGETAYWDNAAGLFTNVVGTNTKCGMFLEAAASGDAAARMELTNTPAL